MKIERTSLLRSSVLALLAAFNPPAEAVQKPQTMEDMWKIIEAQQKQIDEMKTAMAEAAKKQPSPVPAAAQTNVKTLERKTDILSQEVEKLRTNLVIPEETLNTRAST